MSATLFRTIRSSGLGALSSLVMIFAMGTGPLVTSAHNCQSAENNPAAAQGHEHHAPPGGGSAPDSSVPAECSCIGAACNPPHAQLPATPIVPMARLVATSTSPILAPDTPIQTAVAHLLPYAQGPPV